MRLSVCILLASVCSTTLASAQSATQTVVDPAAATTTAPPAQADTPGSDIIVTATRDAQAISKVPISITALTQATLDKQGVKNIGDIATVSPGVSFDSGVGGSTRISIRGIDSQSGAATTGLYIDDVPIQSRSIGIGQTSSNAYPAVFDLDRIEVLRGPQGTLFGAGSEGGTIRFITPQPSLTAYSAYARGEVAGTDNGAPSYEAGAAVGGPLVVDRLGFRVSAFHRRDGGYIDRVDPLTGETIGRNINHVDTTALKGAISFAPTDDILVTPSIFYQRKTAPYKDVYWGYLSDKSDERFRTGTQVDQPITDRMMLPSLAISWLLGGATLISNTSYYDRYFTSKSNGSNFLPATLGYPISPGNFVPGAERYSAAFMDWNKQKNFTQEVRLQSDRADAPLRWVVGLFYQHAKSTAREDIFEQSQATIDTLTEALAGIDEETFFGVPLLPGARSFTSTTTGIDEQFAGFVDLTYRLTPKLSVSAGARYAKTTFDYATAADGPYNGGPSSGSGKQRQKPFTPKFNVSFQADPANLFYATAAKGFRVGGVNTPVADRCGTDLAALGLTRVPASVDADTVWSYEVGAKNRFFNRALTVSSSLFWIKWDKIQQIINLPACGFSFIANAGKAESRGFDLQADAVPARGVALGGSVSYTDAKFTQPVVSGVDANGNQAFLAKDGTPLDIAPWTATAYVQFDRTIADRNAYLRLDYRYIGRHRTETVFNDPTLSSYRGYPFVRPATHLANARLGMTIDGIDASIFVDNLFNYHADQDLVSGPATNLIKEFVTERPRTIGLTIVYRR